MISRKSAAGIAAAYYKLFTSSGRYSSGQRYTSVQSRQIYDFLYENEYRAWFCNQPSKFHEGSQLDKWLKRIHTGESLYEATSNCTWEQRQALGQELLRNMARDFHRWYLKQDSFYLGEYQNVHDNLLRQLELDGYVFRGNDLVEDEAEPIDTVEETGLLASIHSSLGLTSRDSIFQFLTVAEDHYREGRWRDCITNCRNFHEMILRQVVIRHAGVKGTPVKPNDVERAAWVRDYLKKGGLIDEDEHDALRNVYGMLSDKGPHPTSMAEKDHARLLRNLSLVMTQFVMLRLGAVLNVT